MDHTATYKKQKNKSALAPSERSPGKFSFQFMDHRPEAAVQRKLQGIAEKYDPAQPIVKKKDNTMPDASRSLKKEENQSTFTNSFVIQGKFISTAGPIQLMREEDKKALLAYYKELDAANKKFAGALRKKVMPLFRLEISLDDAKAQLDSALEAAKMNTELMPVFTELTSKGKFPAEVQTGFKEFFESLLSEPGSVHHLKSALIQRFDQLRTEVFGGEREAGADSNFSVFKANVLKFFPAGFDMPQKSLDQIASRLLHSVSDEQIRSCLGTFAATPEIPQKREDVKDRLHMLMAGGIELLPRFIQDKIQKALEEKNAMVVDPFSYAKLSLQEDLHSLSSSIKAGSGAACRLAANYLSRAIIVSSGRFLPSQNAIIGKGSVDQYRLDRIMVHETVHAANEEAEGKVEQMLGHIFAEIFTEITANTLLKTAPTAYQGFIPRGREIIAKVYGDMGSFLTSFFTGNLGAVKSLLTAAQVDSLKRIDGDEAGLTTFLQITAPLVMGKPDAPHSIAEDPADALNTHMAASAATAPKKEKEAPMAGGHEAGKTLDELDAELFGFL